MKQTATVGVQLLHSLKEGKFIFFSDVFTAVVVVVT